MRKSDIDPLTPGQQWRLRIALDRVMPPFSPPRYQASRASHIRAWRVAPVTLALAITGVLAMSAYAATGSPNPAIWGQRAASAIHSVRLAPAIPPAEPSGPAPAALPGTSAKSAGQTTQHSGTSQDQGQDRYGQPRESPEPSDNHYGTNWPRPSPSPSPSPSPWPSHSPWPPSSPTPSPPRPSPSPNPTETAGPGPSN